MILDKLRGIAANGAANLVEKLGDAGDKLFTNKEELTKVVNEHIEKMADLQAREVEAEIKDRDSARNREIQIATSEKAPLINKIIQPVLAILIMGSCFLFWYLMIYTEISDNKRELVAGITGSLTTLSMSIVSYFFGSSTGSKAKQEALDKMMNK